MTQKMGRAAGGLRLGGERKESWARFGPKQRREERKKLFSNSVFPKPFSDFVFKLFCKFEIVFSIQTFLKYFKVTMDLLYI
jgi:hypothetical protein